VRKIELAVGVGVDARTDQDLVGSGVSYGDDGA
jgi:hypothetical protein